LPCDAAVPNVLDVSDCVVRGPGWLSLRLPRLSLGPGESAALFGPSGGGKTTLLLAACGLLRRPGWTVAGAVQIAGVDVLTADLAAGQALRNSAMAFLPQDAKAALDPLQPVGRWLGQVCGADEPARRAACARLGLDDASLLRRLPLAISGGEAQRVLLAVALLRSPKLVVADEPTANLDGASRQRVQRALHELRDRGAAVLVATHDVALPAALGARVLAPADDAFVPASLPDLAWPTAPRDGATDDVLLALAGVHHAFAGRPVLAGIDLEVRRGEVVAIVGPSGAGKTTLARLAAGRLSPAAGTIQRPAGVAVQMLAQDAFASLTPGRRLDDLLAEARAPGFLTHAGAEAVALPEGALARTAERLSVGEQRRAALLRALAVEPHVLVLDEPTASLDPVTAQAVVATLLALRARTGLAMLLITHDLELARAVAARIYTLQGGRLCPG